MMQWTRLELKAKWRRLHFILLILFKGAGLLLGVGNCIVTSLFWCVLLSLAHKVSLHKSNKAVKCTASLESIFYLCSKKCLAVILWLNKNGLLP